MTSRIPVVVFWLILSTTCLAQSDPCDKTKNFCVGAEKTEITAPPGFPTGGYGPAGNFARGSWSRNWARAFVIKDPGGAVVVLVSCDTFAVPLTLTSYVWDNVKGELRRAGMTLKPEGLLISATHTHQGAGNYMDASAYNLAGSFESGFSKPLFDFLVKQISDAIIKAAEKIRPAKLSLHQAKIKTGYDEPFIVNRSPATFAHNWDAHMVLSELGDFAPDKACPEKHLPDEPEDGWNLGRCPRLRAVDRRMLVLEAKEISSGLPIADLVFFAVHPTVLIPRAPLFNSDFTGYAMDALERKAGNKVVAGFFNGAEGDVAARRFYRDVLEVVERGKQFLTEVEAVLSKPEKVQVLEPKILVHARVINTRSSADRNCVDGKITGLLARNPLLGAAQPGGAELDRAIFFDFGWRTGVRNFKAADDQGGKKRAIDLPFFKRLTDFISNLLFPSRLSVTYLKLGNFSLGAVPLEVSTTAGYRIRKYMESSDEVFQLLGLTNGYASYMATASEYAAQDYMGASTLWGPNQAEFFRCQFAQLRNRAPEHKYKFPETPVGPGNPFGPAVIGQRRDLPDEELEEIIRDKDHMPVRQLPFFEWSERVPRHDKYTAASKRQIWITTTTNETVDDTDVGFIKILRQAPVGDCQVWNAIWLGPLIYQPAAIEYVFNVKTARGDRLTSGPFSVNLNSSTKPSPQKPLKGQPSCN